MSHYVDLVRPYNSGDRARIAACFTPDAAHYYQRMSPHFGAQTIGDHLGSQAREIDGHWTVENGVDGGNQAVVEWTMTWRRGDQRRLDRGTDWFRFDGDLISQVRCYHHSSPRNRSGDLVGFDHAGAGHVIVGDPQ